MQFCAFPQHTKRANQIEQYSMVTTVNHKSEQILVNITNILHLLSSSITKEHWNYWFLYIFILKDFLRNPQKRASDLSRYVVPQKNAIPIWFLYIKIRTWPTENQQIQLWKQRQIEKNFEKIMDIKILGLGSSSVLYSIKWWTNQSTINSTQKADYSVQRITALTKPKSFAKFKKPKEWWFYTYNACYTDYSACESLKLSMSSSSNIEVTQA